MKISRVALCCMFIPALPAADILGMVTATQKRIPVPDAHVILHGDGRELRTVTDEHGTFGFTGVDTSDRMSLEVSAGGFQPYARAIPRIPANSAGLEWNLTLRIFTNRSPSLARSSVWRAVRRV